ncbi:hypothetical protein Ate02nite_61500 [Paractinoplanes tereljensis]|uniref:Tc1-like transposase DDE domain-containing protein n=1 Tax=Paractinoplanes tereljensis TaxID=571912 RepID=A0A919TWM3_9ACTN|nr:transposase [Actinoplanes tereljensis]GIF23420.1 hypothetical protein Ate02nite_61500 [Actinoplanes tereljensis]
MSPSNSGQNTVRVSVAGLCCYRPGERSRLIYRTLLYRGRKGEPKGLREPDLFGLLDAAHQQLLAPIVLAWDRLSLHKTPTIRAAIAARPWLRVYLLPAYPPELNPVEKVWSTVKGSLANLAVAVKNRLSRMQYRPNLIDGFFTGTGLSPPTPSRPRKVSSGDWQGARWHRSPNHLRPEDRPQARSPSDRRAPCRAWFHTRRSKCRW